MAHKTLVNGTAYEIKGGRTLVNGTGYGIKGGRTLVNGTGYNISFGIPIGSLPVGSSVFLNVGGVKKEFIIVQQGNPDSSKYDASCNGTWLLMKELYTRQAFYPYNNHDYEKSSAHSYLNWDFFGLLDANIQSAIKQVKIPYRQGSGSSFSVNYGAYGLSAKIFLLSGYEVGGTDSYMPAEGVKLNYFLSGNNDAANAKRIAYLNSSDLDGSVYSWWLRTPYPFYSPTDAWNVELNGRYSNGMTSNPCAIRPAFIMPFDSKVDDNFNVIA